MQAVHISAGLGRRNQGQTSFKINKLQGVQFCEHEGGTNQELSISTSTCIVLLFWMKDEGV